LHTSPPNNVFYLRNVVFVSFQLQHYGINDLLIYVNGGNKFTDAVNATKDWFGRVGKGADKAHEDNGRISEFITTIHIFSFCIC
jgi:hypothetical protein